MKLIVGLGNPGEKYKKTRHNIGWRIVDTMLDKKEKWLESKGANCFYIRKQIDSQEVEIIKPLTFMNNSGIAVSHILKKHNLKPQDIIVIHDDLDLPLGTIRVKLDGSAGGHNGVASIINHLKTPDFVRLKIGIANEKRDLVPAEKFVLEKFSRDEEKIIEKIIEKSKEIINDLMSGKVKNTTFVI